MTPAWIVYLLLLSAVLTAGASAGSRLIRRTALSGSRWPWLGAMIAGIMVPLGRLLWPGAAGEAGESIGLTVSLGDMVPALSSGPAADPAFGSVLMVGWAALSLAVGVRWMLSFRASRMLLREASVDPDTDRRVLRSNTGPAVVGVVRSRILIPRWAARLPARDRRLMLAHERSHIEAGDPLALLIGQLATVIMPWNPLTWHQLARLRESVEIDCDRRVSGRFGTAAYARLLLEVARRPLEVPMPSPALIHSPTQLERRLRAMTKKPSRSPRLVLSTALAVATLAMVGACGLDQPPLTPEPLPAVTAAANAEVEASPVWDERPNLTNRAAFAAALTEAYPTDLRANGVRGQVMLRVHITERGDVDRAELLETSGYPAMDEGAQRVMLDVAAFEPARLNGQPVATWIELPLNFASR